MKHVTLTNKVCLSLLSFVLPVMLLLIFAAPVFAAGFTVDDAGDAGDVNPGNGTCATAGGVCTLRAAIEEANTWAGADVITFDGNYTINVATHLLINSDLSIDGEDNTIIVDGGGATRVFYIAAGDVSFADLTITNGNAPQYEYGGGINHIAGNLRLEATQLFNNSAHLGGALYVNQGNAVLTGTQVLSNSAAGYGGGLYLREGSAVLTSTQVLSNSATGYGGGLYVDRAGAVLTVNGGEVNYNSSNSSSGGGLSVAYGSAVLTGTQVLSNTAHNRGGGLDVHQAGAVLSVNGGEINYNSSDSRGGGLSVAQGSVVLTGTRVLSNAAHNSGGGLYTSSSSAVLTGTEVVGNSAFSGGGLYISESNATLRINGGRVDHNSVANNGGGLYISSGSAVLTGTQVVGNSASTSGGGLLVDQGSTVLTGTQVLSNTANFYGGGLYVSGSSTTLSMISMNGGKVNYNSGSSGGGVHISFGSAILTGTQVFSNSGSQGGGLYLAHSSVVLTETQVLNNSAALYGGGLYIIEADTTLSITGGEINYNSADYSGGGLSSWAAAATLTGTQVFSNAAATSGGGLYINTGRATLTNTGLDANLAPSGSAIHMLGTGIITAGSDLTVAGEVFQAGGTFAGSNYNLNIGEALVLTGGDFYAPDAPHGFILTGPFTHTGGSYYQTQNVTGSADVGFPKTGGLILNANEQDLATTVVTITAGVDCSGLESGEAVKHCYNIAPSNATGRDAIITFFYHDSEIPSDQNCTAMEAYRWDGTWNNQQTRDTGYGNEGRLCGNDPQSIRVTGVTDLSLFIVSEGGVSGTGIYLPLIVKN